MKILYTAVLYVLCLCAVTANASADIIWSVYTLQSQQSGPIITKALGDGVEFVIDDADFLHVPSASRDLLYSLAETSFTLSQAPSNGSVEIRIIFDMNGGTFTKTAGKTLFLNMDVEIWVNGGRNDNLTFSRSPLVMTIPRDSLSDLLNACNLSKDDIICAYYDGGVFSADGVTTSNMTSRLETNIDRPGKIVGGKSGDLGVESNVKINSWYIIKQMFK